MFPKNSWIGGPQEGRVKNLRMTTLVAKVQLVLVALNSPCYYRGFLENDGLELFRYQFAVMHGPWVVFERNTMKYTRENDQLAANE